MTAVSTLKSVLALALNVLEDIGVKLAPPNQRNAPQEHLLHPGQRSAQIVFVRVTARQDPKSQSNVQWDTSVSLHPPIPRSATKAVTAERVV